MKKQAFLFLALALAFAGSFSAYAGPAQETLTWEGRTLVGKKVFANDYEDSFLTIGNLKFGKLYGPGDPNVFETREYQNARATAKTTVDKIEKGKGYYIILSKDQYLEVTGTQTQDGFTAPIYFLIKGPTSIGYSTYQYAYNLYKKPDDDKLDFPIEQLTKLYFDEASFSSDIARQFVDKYVIPIVSYNAMKHLYIDTKMTFVNYVANGRTDADKEKRRGQCPENILCTCKGDIVAHMTNSIALNRGLFSSALSLIPYGGGAVIEALTGSEKQKMRET